MLGYVAIGVQTMTLIVGSILIIQEILAIRKEPRLQTLTNEIISVELLTSIPPAVISLAGFIFCLTEVVSDVKILCNVIHASRLASLTVSGICLITILVIHFRAIRFDRTHKYRKFRRFVTIWALPIVGASVVIGTVRYLLFSALSGQDKCRFFEFFVNGLLINSTKCQNTTRLLHRESEFTNEVVLVSTEDFNNVTITYCLNFINSLAIAHLIVLTVLTLSCVTMYLSIYRTLQNSSNGIKIMKFQNTIPEQGSENIVSTFSLSVHLLLYAFCCLGSNIAFLINEDSEASSITMLISVVAIDSIIVAKPVLCLCCSPKCRRIVWNYYTAPWIIKKGMYAAWDQFPDLRVLRRDRRWQPDEHEMQEMAAAAEMHICHPGSQPCEVCLNMINELQDRPQPPPGLDTDQAQSRPTN